MTVAVSSADISAKLSDTLKAAVLETRDNILLVKTEAVPDLISFLKNSLDFDYLVDLTSVDYWEYFELVYRLVSLKNNQTVIVKTRLNGRENPVAPSVTKLFYGAMNMEREIYDLMGIIFEGHPKLKRILLWEGFQGYPLRRDYL
jgi:NADH-quinone oxidoreductase subunit C